MYVHIYCFIYFDLFSWPRDVQTHKNTHTPTFTLFNGTPWNTLSFRVKPTLPHSLLSSKTPQNDWSFVSVQAFIWITVCCYTYRCKIIWHNADMRIRRFNENLPVALIFFFYQSLSCMSVMIKCEQTEECVYCTLFCTLTIFFRGRHTIRRCLKCYVKIINFW